MKKQIIVSTDLQNEDLYKDLVKYAEDNERPIAFVVKQAVEEFLRQQTIEKIKQQQ